MAVEWRDTISHPSKEGHTLRPGGQGVLEQNRTERAETSEKKKQGLALAQIGGKTESLEWNTSKGGNVLLAPTEAFQVWL